MTLTASGKEQALVDFYQQLSRDGIGSVTELARKARVGRAALCQVLNGKRDGAQTWKHIIPLLSADALILLKQCSAWNIHAKNALTDLVIERSGQRLVKAIEKQVFDDVVAHQFPL